MSLPVVVVGASVVGVVAVVATVVRGGGVLVGGVIVFKNVAGDAKDDFSAAEARVC